MTSIVALHSLPDLLVSGLDLVFVGINPGERSAQRGHYYAHPGNAFWRVLSASPLVDLDVTPEDDAVLHEAPERGIGPFRIGLTDVVKRVLTDSTGITDAELRASVPAFRARIAAARPRAVCFTTTRGFTAIYPRAWRSRAWGRQDVPALEGAEVWVMPSPSGRAAAYHGETAQVLADLAASLRSAAPERPIPLPPSLRGKGVEMLGVEPPTAPGERAPRPTTHRKRANA